MKRITKIITKVLASAGYVPAAEARAAADRERSAQMELAAVRSELAALRTFRDQRKFFYDVFAESPIPSGENEKSKRRDYMGRVAVFHAEILLPVLRRFINESLNMFKDEEVVGDKSLLVKGGVFFAEELIEWGKNCTAEHLSFTADEAANKK